jgi:cell division protein FtsI (penicillin-binding protein 3)
MSKLTKAISSIFRWQYDASSARQRIYFATACFLVWFLAINARIVYLTFSPERAAVQALESQLPRRTISDRWGNLLAVNLPIASLFAYPHKIFNHEEAALALSSAVPSLSYREAIAKLKAGKRFTWLKREISPQEQTAINSLGLNGIESRRGCKRFYPYGKLLSHIIGYVDLDGVGLAGIERGAEALIKDANNPEPIALSLDMYLQNIVAEELIAAKNHFNAKGGNAIVADVVTGEILAFVNEPNFNPNNISALDQDALMNQSSLGVYELGSVFKTVIIAAALDTGTLDLHDVYNLDSFKVGGHTVKDFSETSGWKTTAQIFAKSSNKGLSQIAFELGEAKVREYLKKLGLFDVIPHIEIPEKARPVYPKKYPWSDLTLATASYGYSVAISPLHCVQALIPLVNGGKIIPLTVFKKSSPAQGTRVLQESTSEKLKILMRLTVSHGTCQRAAVPGQDIGCKSGTANKLINGKYCKSVVRCSAIAAFPISNPKYVIYVMLDEPKPNAETGPRVSAGLTAAPLIGKIASRMASRYALEKQNLDHSYWTYLLNVPKD